MPLVGTNLMFLTGYPICLTPQDHTRAFGYDLKNYDGFILFQWERHFAAIFEHFESVCNTALAR